jgi:hypothetical protein
MRELQLVAKAAAEARRNKERQQQAMQKSVEFQPE